MNVSARMRELLGDAMPDPDALLTGAEYVDRVLLPLDRARAAARTRAHRTCASSPSAAAA